MTAPVKIYSQEWPEGAAGLSVRKDPDHNHHIPYIREDVVKELARLLDEAINPTGFVSIPDYPTWEKQARAALKKVEGL